VNAYPFLLLKKRAADLIIQRVGTALARWATNWSALPHTAITCVPANDHEFLATTSDWHQYIAASGASVWIGLGAGLERHFERMLFNLPDMDPASEEERPSAIATSIVREALEDLSACLIGEFADNASKSLPPTVFPDRLLRPGSGAALCSIGLGSTSIGVLLPAESVPTVASKAAPETRPPLATLHHALGKVPVKLSVEVSRTELTLGYLKTLAVGDVLALPTGVDQALHVAGPGDTSVCQAHLGNLEGFHAIELIKSASQACPDHK
jgi:flagellar motor switch/type III secretory pathway protein FliN